MSYDDYENSDSDGYVAELYEFVGLFNSYYYTSFAEDLVVSGRTYISVPGLKRKNLKVTSVGGSSSGDLEINLPFDLAITKEYAFTDIPPTLNLTLRRGHRGDPGVAFPTIWSGEVGSWTVKGKQASLKVPSAFATALDATIPAQRWQGPCSHLLYDQRCGILRADYDHATQVVSLSTNIINVASLPWTGTEGVGGEIVNIDTGERRTIRSHSGLVVTVKVGFTDMRPGSNVILYQGCDHSAATCKLKFNNLDQYGGCNLVPSLNPFGSTLR